jgi:hypothetical protein
MHHNITSFLTVTLFCTVILVTGCQNDDIPALEYRSSGVIKGTIQGTSRNGDVLNEDFKYTQHPRAWNTAEQQNWATVPHYTVTPAHEGNPFETTVINLYSESTSETGQANIRLYLWDEDQTKVSAWNVNMLHREQKDNQTVVFEWYGSQTEITEFSFDRTSGRVKGKFILSGASNSTGKDARVEGEFDMTIKQLVR